MAYLRREKEIIEVDFSVGDVWAAVAKAVATIDWKTEETDSTAHRLVAKTKSNFMAYASNFIIELKIVNEKTTRVYVSAETPVTTITGIVDFGKTRERIDSFLEELMKQLGEKKGKQPEE